MTNSTPPLNEAEYIEWAQTTLGFDLGRAGALVYRQHVTYVHGTVEEHPFFQGFDRFLAQAQLKYQSEVHADLFMLAHSDPRTPRLKLKRKSYESVVNKTYRHNVVLNRKFADPPKGNWITPENWFERLNDIVRGTIVCKYIDGPRMLAEWLDTYAKQLGLESSYTSQQRDMGYYAYHFYVKIPIDMMTEDRREVNFNVTVEIQLTTQLQEIMYEITHRYYEHTRDNLPEDPHAWKWEVNSDRFRAGYLGHTLHLLEAIILDLRDSDSSTEVSIQPEEDND